MEDIQRLVLSGNTKLAGRTCLVSTGSSLKETKETMGKIRSENKKRGHCRNEFSCDHYVVWLYSG